MFEDGADFNDQAWQDDDFDFCTSESGSGEVGYKEPSPEPIVEMTQTKPDRYKVPARGWRSESSQLEVKVVVPC